MTAAPKKKAKGAPAAAKGVRIACKGAGLIQLDSLEPFQGELKSLDEEGYQKARAAILKHGFSFPFFIWRQGGHNYTLDGHQRDRVLRRMRDEEGFRIAELPVAYIDAGSVKEAKEKILLLSSQYGKLSAVSLYNFLQENELDFGALEKMIALPQIDLAEFRSDYYPGDDDVPRASPANQSEARARLREKFGAPPFTILDSRQGYWQDRKRTWLALGIKSELGRGANLLNFSKTLLEPDEEKRHKRFAKAYNTGDTMPYFNGKGQTPEMGGKADNPEALIPHFYDKLNAGMRRDEIIAEFLEKKKKQTSAINTQDWVKARNAGDAGLAANFDGTSIFDPVLCELMYCWFSKADATVLDPFAGGSVRGIVAGTLGRRYCGVDVSAVQVEANRQQGKEIKCKAMPKWIRGDARDIKKLVRGPFDFLFSCPPYGDLERYSDAAADLSTMPFEKFRAAYREIIASACEILHAPGFAAFVVGDYRDRKTGLYRNFVSETISAFQTAGLALYNEAIFITPVASLAIRASNQFEGSRKLGKMHQNVLVFVKGDPKAATAGLGKVFVPPMVAPEDPSAEAATG